MSSTRKPTIIGYSKSGAPIWLVQGGDGREETGDTTEETGETEGTEEEPEETEGAEEEPEGADKNSDLAKAIKRRDRAIAEARRLKAELDKVNKKDDAPDPIAQANDRLVRSEVRTQLAAIGVTDKADVKAVLEAIRLDGIAVDANGDVDEDEVEDRLSELRRIFGSKVTRQVPKVSTRDKGGDGVKKTDSDSDRYARILRR